jgi:nitrous oxidase accessory protein NosD
MLLVVFRRFASVATAVSLAAMALFLVFVVMHNGPALASSSTIRYVDGDNGVDTGDCTAFPCQTINYALSQASGGDTIQVAASNYTESLTLDKPVNLLGAGAETTVVRAVSGQRVMTVTGETITNSTVISGFTFTGGNPENDVGGGVLVVTSTPTIRNNRIISNGSGAEGGGLYIRNSAGVSLTDNTISGNFAATGTQGGGLYFSYSPSAMLSANTIVENKAWHGRGGGVYFSYSPSATLSANTIARNVASWGGGLYLRHSPGATLSHNSIISNVAGYGPGKKFGGGLFADSSGNTTLEGNEFRGGLVKVDQASAHDWFHFCSAPL